MQSIPISPVAPPAPAGVLLLDSDAMTSKLAPMLRDNYRVTTSSSVAIARAFLARTIVDLIITDIQLPDGSAIDLCREAKALPNAPAVLVITDQVERVPDALEAGCDGVLLKPFASNLLFTRIGRLLRDRSTVLHRSSGLRDRPAHVAAKIQHLRERSNGTNRVWPTTHCPHCDHAGVTGFEFTSHRRAWYACLQCKKVWLGKRQE